MTDWVQKQFERIRQEQSSEDQKGGPGSGHFGHEGRPGHQGGSQPGSGGGGAGGGEASGPPRKPAAARAGGGTKPKAQQEYEKRRSAIDGQLTSIQAGLKKHAAEFKKEPKHWGYYGDLSHYRARLGEALDFIQNVDEGTNWSSESMQRETRELHGHSAREGYDKAASYIRDMLKTMKTSLDAHKRDYMDGHTQEWGYAGDLSEVHAILKEIDDALYDREE